VELPLNFDCVRLSQNDIAKVRAVVPDYEPEP
jgi:hypothetical protein